VDIMSAADAIMNFIKDRRRAVVAVTGVHGIMEAQDDDAFKTVLNRADLNVPDGMPLVWLGRLAGFPRIGRVFGPDLMLAIGERMARAGQSAFYYGGQPGVAEDLAAEMTRRFPGTRTAGTYSPPFRDLDDAEAGAVATMINASGAAIVWVGLSTPKQERWMMRFRPLLSAPVLIGVGAAFDYNTGRIRRAPRWMQRCALEWAYRLYQEPRRLWRRYARNNPRFLLYLLCERLGLRAFD
jgi:N-acetylglucosaminyldiphosphoundecaprenol N-acetyl-beta-D-mannosaminyltransferase